MLSFLPGRLRTRRGSISDLKGMRTHCPRVQRLPPKLYHPSYWTLTSSGRMPCPLRRLWPYRFREQPPYVQTPLFVRSIVVSNYLVNFILFLQMDNYKKSLARRASFAEGSTIEVKPYKVKVASLTFELGFRALPRMP